MPILMLGLAVMVQCAVTAEGPVRGQPYETYATADSLGRTIRFHIGEAAAGQSLPLVLYVQGSGAQPHFVQDGGRLRPANGHATLADAAAGRSRVLIVEKPGVSQPSSFRVEHTLERWVEALSAALCAARSLPGVDTTRLLVVGHSEGGLVAARLAARHDFVTHVAVLAGGGPSQLFDLRLLARRGVFFRDVSDDPAARERYVLAQWDSVRAHPDDADRLFFGHPYRRWSSFLVASPIDELSRTRARVFLAQGADDQAVTRESFDSLAVTLTRLGKRPVVRLVAGADHSFAVAGADGWRAILTEVTDWFRR